MEKLMEFLNFHDHRAITKIQLKSSTKLSDTRLRATSKLSTIGKNCSRRGKTRQGIPGTSQSLFQEVSILLEDTL